MRLIGRIFIALVFLALLAGAGVAAALLWWPWAQDRVISSIIAGNVGRNRPDLLADDALRVMVCGSGSPMPDPERKPACNLVVAGGRIFVVDTGAGSWARTGRWGLDLSKVEAVLLTHFHSDHISDLGEANLNTWVAGRPAPLLVYGGPGIEQVVDGFNTAFARDRSYRIAHHGADFLRPELGVMQPRLIAGPDGGPLKPVWPKLPESERRTGVAVVYEKDGLTITAIAVDHAPVEPAYAYRFDYKGRSVAISGDTAKSASLARALPGVDVLLHEVMDMGLVREMFDAAEARGATRIAKILSDIPSYHASPRDAAETAADAAVPHLVLTHIIPPVPYWLAQSIFRRDTSLPGVTTTMAYDGMMITLPLGSKDVRFEDLGR
jgi:ribonuclease Z